MLKSRIEILEEENAHLIAAAAVESLRVESFLREVSHDLRNSLSTVLTGSEVLLAINSSSELAPLLQSIQRQANVIAHIADRIVASYEQPDRLLVAKSAETQIESKSLKILAIDDRREVLLPLRVLLTKEGHEIVVAEDGVTGLAKMVTFKPDIVLCDIQLPGILSGLDVARSIRLRPEGKLVYVVALSGNAQATDLEDSAQAGFDFHIAKPITITALRNLIDNRPRFYVEAEAALFKLNLVFTKSTFLDALTASSLIVHRSIGECKARSGQR